MGEYVYTTRRARVKHTCKMGDGLISPGEHYLEATIGGGGLGSLKFPDRIHLNCKDAYISMKEERQLGNTHG